MKERGCQSSLELEFGDGREKIVAIKVKKRMGKGGNKKENGACDFVVQAILKDSKVFQDC